MRNLTISFVALVGLAALSSTANAQEVKIGGSLGINFSNNFNKPAGGNTFLYNSKDAQFSLNLAELTVSREATARNRGGFHLRFIDGDVRNALLMPGAFVAEAYGTQLIEAGDKDIRLDVGQYRTFVGSEGLGIDNFISRSFAFQFLTPILGQGVRAGFDLNDSTRVTGSIQNKYSGTGEDNRDLSYALTVDKKLGDASDLRFNLISGRENVGGNNRETNLAGFQYSRQLSDSNALHVDYTLRSGRDAADTRYEATGVKGVLVLGQSNGGALSLRGEYLQQNSADSGILPTLTATPGTKPTLTSIAVSYKLPATSKTVSTVLEYRYDRSNDFFFGASNGLKKDQGTLSIAQVYKFYFTVFVDTSARCIIRCTAFFIKMPLCSLDR